MINDSNGKWCVYLGVITEAAVVYQRVNAKVIYKIIISKNNIEMSYISRWISEIA